MTGISSISQHYTLLHLRNAQASRVDIVALLQLSLYFAYSRTMLCRAMIQFIISENMDILYLCYWRAYSLYQLGLGVWFGH